jgi:hypothetical protein
MSHEMSESITDPYLDAWYDNNGNEVGDECAYIYGDSLSLQGAPGAKYNQTINGHPYFIQEEFSNSAFATDEYYGCAQSDQSSVVFDPNGGFGSMPAQFGVSPSTLPTNTFTNSGYLFEGWNTAYDGSGTPYANGASFPFNDSATLYAQWALPPRTVTFSANGGTGSMNPETDNAPTPLSSNAFSLYGHSFAGWNTAANGSGTFYANGAVYPFNSGATLYAQWAVTTYTVTFNANGGSGTMASETSGGFTTLTPNTFTRAGYTFLGWYGVVDGVGGIYYRDGASYAFGSSVTLYAQWEILLPSAPLNLAAHVGTSSVTLTWSAPASGGPPDDYLLYEGTAISNFGVPISKLSFVVTGLKPGETHTFSVIAENGAGSSPHSNEVVVTVPRSKTLTNLTISPASVLRLPAKLVDFRVKVLLPGTGPVHGGAVRILSGSKLLCSLTLSKSGTGSCHVNSSRLKSGHDSVTAVYAGNSSDRGSKSSTRTIIVT